ITDGPAREELLRGILPAYEDLWQGSLEFLVYKPERRYVARLQGKAGSSALVKVHALRGCASACGSAGSFHSSGPLRVARRLGRSNHHYVVVHEWLSGDVLQDRFVGDDCHPARLSQVGAALAELHRQSTRRLRNRPTETFAAGLGELAEWL